MLILGTFECTCSLIATPSGATDAGNARDFQNWQLSVTSENAAVYAQKDFFKNTCYAEILVFLVTTSFAKKSGKSCLIGSTLSPYY